MTKNKKKKDEDLKKEKVKTEKSKKKNLNEEVSSESEEIGKQEVKNDSDEIVNDLNNKIDELIKDNEDYKKHLQRLKAEFDNYRKKTNKEREDWKNIGAADLLSKLLMNFSDFDRAFGHGVETETEKGFKMVYDKMMDNLKKEGLEEIPSVGEEFDPEFHDALQMIDVTEGKDNHIVREYEKGYLYKGKIIRHSKVIVGRLKQDDENEEKKNNNSDMKNKIDTKA